MNARTRWLAWTGPLFTVIFAVVIFALEGDSPGEKASGATVASYYSDHSDRLLAQVFLTPLLALLLLMFVCHLRSLARAAGGAGVWQTLMVAGSVIWAGAALLGSMVTLATVDASDNGFEDAAQTLNVLNNSSWLPFIGGIAVAMVGAGATVLTTGLLPRWMGWVAVVVGVVSLVGPGGFVGFMVAPLWLLAAGIMLATRAASDPVPAAG